MIEIGTQTDPSIVGAGNKLVVSEVATAAFIHIKFDCQRISKSNLEGKQLLRIRCKTDKIKKHILKIAKFLNKTHRFNFY